VLEKLKINDRVWSIYDPLKGYLQAPQEDYVTQIDHKSSAVILQGLNYMDDETLDHWTNDYYGNLISTNYLFSSYEEACEVLSKYYEAKLVKVMGEARRYEKILADLTF
jgi:hypothetical protein